MLASASKLCMAHATATRPIQFETRQQKGPGRWGRVALILLIAGAVLFAVPFGLCRWRFAAGPVLQDLREASDSQVEVRAFRQTYFPFPGCVLEGLVFRHGPPQAGPLINVEKVTIRGSYL